MDKIEELMSAVLNMCMNINKLYEHLNQLTERVVRIEEAAQAYCSVQNSNQQTAAQNGEDATQCALAGTGIDMTPASA